MTIEIAPWVLPVTYILATNCTGGVKCNLLISVEQLLVNEEYEPDKL